MGLSLSGINELIYLSADSIISIDKVEFWLLKNQDEYNHFKSIREGELPAISNYATAEDKFVDLFEQLEEVSRYYKYEPYCKEQLETYTSIKNDTEKLEKWLSTNENFYYEELIHFSVNYLDYLGDNKEYHLKIFSYLNKDIGLFIDGKDFESTIELIEKFNQNI
ncbi:hypothetical protein [Psychroserpens sp. S379A]|uniref:hypothetical protein n=1 Tax=Psychroserpens sp. S379A TaxID=3415137 RepID=UPI003C7CE4AF